MFGSRNSNSSEPLLPPPPPVNLCSSLRVVYVSSKDLIWHSDNRYKMSKFNGLQLIFQRAMACLQTFYHYKKGSSLCISYAPSQGFVYVIDFM